MKTWLFNEIGRPKSARSEILLYIPHLQLWYFHNKEERRNRLDRLFRPIESDVQISDRFCMGLDEFSAGIDGIAHEHIEGPIGLGRVFYCD